MSLLTENHTMWIAILAILYAFSLYVYFFPTPLGAMEGFRCQRTAKNRVWP